MMDKALRDRLIADPAISAIVGTRVYWIDRPQSASALPAIVLQKVSPGRTYTTKGATTLQGTRVQFDLFGLDYRDIAPLYEALLAEMEQPETVAGINFGMAFLDSQRDYPPEDVNGIGPVYRISADRSEEHTSELQSLMRISYAAFCLKKKK